MPNQAKKAISTLTPEKSTKTKKKKKNSSSTRSNRKELNSGSDCNEGLRKKSKSKQSNRGRNSTSSVDSAVPCSTSQETSATVSSSCRESVSSSGRSTSSSSGENLVVSYQSDTCALDCTRGIITNNPSKSITSRTTHSINESLRWNDEPENTDVEGDRIRVYKINRRKRYIAVGQRNDADGHVATFYA